MVIGIDIDETITNTHDEAYKYVKKYAPNLKFNNYCDDIKNKDVKAFLEKQEKKEDVLWMKGYPTDK